MQKFTFVWAVWLIFHLSSCSFTQRQVLRSSSSIFEKGSLAYYKIGQWDQLQYALPGNILQLEALSSFDPNNTDLLALLIQGYTSLAFGLYETLSIDPKNQEHQELAIYYYNKALSIGEKFLDRRNLSIKTLLSMLNDQELLAKTLNKQLRKKDTLTIFYLAQAWAGYLNLNRNQTRLMTHLGAVNNIMTWACSKDKDMEYGSCYLFEAILQASLPPALGGSPEKALNNIATYKKLHPKSYIADLLELQYLIIPSKDKKAFQRKSQQVANKLKLWREKQLKVSYRQDEKVFDSPYQLFNVIAEKRLSLLIINQKYIF